MASANGLMTLMSETMPNFGVKEVRHGVDETHHVAEGHDANILIRWGDPVVAGASEFDPMNQTAAKQAKQFGYNNDFVGFLPLPVGSNGSDHGLLCVNHEYTNPEVMFPGLMRPGAKKLDLDWMTRELVDIELAAHGATHRRIVVDEQEADGAIGGGRRRHAREGSPSLARCDGRARGCVDAMQRRDVSSVHTVEL